MRWIASVLMVDYGKIPLLSMGDDPIPLSFCEEIFPHRRVGENPTYIMNALIFRRFVQEATREG